MNNKITFLTFSILLIFPLIALSQQTINEKYSNLQVLDHPQSLNGLLKQFEGRVIYIDLMASWCKPCIVELKESKKLNSYFEKNNIVNIFISIDNKENIEKAINMIQKDSLNGYFVSFHPMIELIKSSSFSEEIETLFMTNKNGGLDISIPKYAIVNKKGEIVVRRAERPSNSALLKKQLERYL